jgi:hypothetical protein
LLRKRRDAEGDAFGNCIVARGSGAGLGELIASAKNVEEGSSVDVNLGDI